MKPTKPNRFLPLTSVIAFAISGSAGATDLFWDGASVGGTGDGVSTYASGTWSTANANWDQGNGLSRLAWNNSNPDNAIFGGTFSTGTKTVTVASDTTVNQIQVNTGSTGANRYDIGASSTQNDFAITFGGTYNDAFPAITGNSGGFLNNNFNAKITGNLTAKGGLVIKHGSNITTPASSGRFSFTNNNNDFTGDIVVAGGNLGFGDSAFGNANNRVVLRGGALFISGAAAGISTSSRNIEVAAPSGLTTNAATSGLQTMNLTGNITGSANLTRYVSTSGSATSEVRFSGDMSGYTGTYESTGGAASLTTIETIATSNGAWKLSGTATLKLNTTDDTHIANGAGKSDLLMNGGTLDMNGRSETINGLSGATGTVQNQLASTASVLTVGGGDASASFGGAIRDNSATGGTVSLTKTGAGTQTLGGTCSHTGATTVNNGTLVLSGTMTNSPITVNNGAKLQVAGIGKQLNHLTLNDGSRLIAPLVANPLDDVYVTNSINFSGGAVTIVPTFTGAPATGTYEFAYAQTGISGTASLAADFSINGPARINGSAAIVDNTIQVTVSELGADLVWNNASNTGIWNLATDANFLNGASDDMFLNYDKVTFNNTSPAGAVTLAGTLLPSEVIVDSSNDFTFAGGGSLSGAATLTKRGDGTLTIGNANSITGDTVIESGTLTVNGSLGTGNTTVNAGATLAGTGSVAGQVAVDGAVAPGGGGIGTLGTGPLGLFGTWQCDISGSQSDKLAVTGNLAISGATLAANFIAPSTAANHVIATYTGSRSGAFATAPAGFEFDYTDAGKVVLWPITTPATGTLTFETNQGYPAAGQVAGTNADPNGAAFSGSDGWSPSGAPGNTFATNSSGEYRGGQAIGCANTGTYTGGRMGGIQHTGTNTLTFDAPYFTGTSAGFMKDADADGLFDITDTGMAFGVGGSPARFQYRNAAFGTENFGPGFTGTEGQWYRFTVTIGGSVGGSRSITMAVRNLTTGVDYDFDGVTPGTQNWTFSVTDAQFGAAPELSDGVYIRATSSARIDNLRATSVEPPAGTAYDAWMANFPSLTGNAALPGADPDNDGVTNLMEFVLDGDPRVSDSGILPRQSIVGDDLVLTFHRRDDSEAFASLLLQVGVNLTGWPVTAAIGAGDGSSGGISWTVAEEGANPDLITVTIPKGADQAKFARLKAVTLAP